MIAFTEEGPALEGPAGRLPLPPDDEIARKLALLYEVRCEGVAVGEACRRHGVSRAWYYKLLERFRQGGSAALASARTGPKSNYRRGGEAERQIVRYRCLDPEASAGVIAQRLRQDGIQISRRSVERVIAEFGLQKKTPPGRA